MGANLVTLAEYKAYAGIASTNQDTQINSIIPIASQLVKTFCHRTFVDYVSESKTEVFSGGWSKLYLKEYPILSIGSVEVSSDYGNNYTELTEFTDYVLDAEDGAITCINAEEFPKVVNGYKVTYTAGYETLPADLKVAVLDLITYYLKNDMSVHSPKAPGTNSVQVEYITTANLPAHIRRVLYMYTGSYD